jgi:hypothetical protein
LTLIQQKEKRQIGYTEAPRSTPKKLPPQQPLSFPTILSRRIPPDNTDPISETTPVFILDFGEVGRTRTSTSDASLTRGIPSRFLLIVVFVFVGGTGELFFGGVGGTVLDVGVLVADVAEIMDLRGGQQDSCA